MVSSFRLNMNLMKSPLGQIVIVSDDAALLSLDFDDHDQRLDADLVKRFPQTSFLMGADPLGVADRVSAYLDGDMMALDDIPVAPRGTEFQRGVWHALRDIPAGKTESYRDLACRVGSPKGFRAIGMANSRNPIAIVLPCHRVISADGSLGGYAGGLDRKAWLLRHEGAWGWG